MTESPVTAAVPQLPIFAADYGGFESVAVVAAGMGVVFWLTDRGSPTSRALALFLMFVGLSIFSNLWAVEQYRHWQFPWWVRLVGFAEAGAFWAATEWGLRVSRTLSAQEALMPGQRRVRLAQVLALIYALTSATLPELRVTQFLGALEEGELQWGFLLFAAPALLAGALVISAGIQLINRKIDRGERIRVMAMLIAMPLLASAIVLPDRFGPIAVALGEVVFLLGALRYHVLQGVRAQFMERFLAPQVAELVRERGMKAAVATRRQRVSIVCCDIRGFSAHAADQPPERIVALLRDFYAAVGKATSAAGGTIKDLAGDGALILIGAPVPFNDHAQRALELAQTLRRDAREMVRRHDAALGLGIGVATGEVAVGIAGEGARLEYVAVGPAVNLASRLCDQALDDQVLCDATSLADAGRELPQALDHRAIKGVGEAVAVFGL